MLKRYLLLATAMAAAAPCAQAHHSFAMFDINKDVTVSGTVKAWQFNAPHSWLQIVSRDAGGHDVVWSFEGGGPSRGYLRADSFKPGQKVSVQTHPMRDGRLAGSLGTVTYEDGHQLVRRFP